MAKEAPFLGEGVGRGVAELERSAHVVEKRGGEQQVGAEARVELRGLAAERGDADRMLEQAAGVAVVAFRRRWKLTQPAPDRLVREEAVDRRLQAGMGDLGGEELEKPVELVGVAPHRGR